MAQMFHIAILIYNLHFNKIYDIKSVILNVVQFLYSLKSGIYVMRDVQRGNEKRTVVEGTMYYTQEYIVIAFNTKRSSFLQSLLYVNAHWGLFYTLSTLHIFSCKIFLQEWTHANKSSQPSPTKLGVVTYAKIIKPHYNLLRKHVLTVEIKSY